MLFLADFSVIKPEPGLLFWTTLIFIAFWIIMSKFAFKPIMQGLKQRELDIQGALDEAKKAREEMSHLMSQNEALLAQAREERAGILKEAKEAKEQIIAEAKERANAEYKRKVESAIQDIENQKLAAMVDLKNKAGQLSIDIAEKILRKELSDKTAQESLAKSLAESSSLS